jgi:general secretion pathway protein D
VLLIFGLLIATLTAASRGAPNASTLLAGETTLARLVDVAAQRLGISIEYDAAALRGSVTLRLADSLTDRQLWRSVNELLASRGFTTIRRNPDDPLFSVVKLQDAERSSSRVEKLQSVPDPQPGFVSVTIRLTSITPRAFIDRVEPLLTPSVGAMAELPEPGSVRIADLTPRVARIVGLASVLDRPDARESVEIVPLRSLPPAEIIRLVRELHDTQSKQRGLSHNGPRLIEATDGRSVILVAAEPMQREIRGLIARLDDQATRDTRLYSPKNFALTDVSSLIQSSVAVEEEEPRLDIVVDELTSTLQITAAPMLHERIEALMERLDAVPMTARRPLRTYPVRNREAQEIAGLVRELIDAGILESAGPVPESRAPDIGESRSASVPGSARAERPRGNSGFAIEHDADTERIQIAVDQSTNRLLAIGEPRDLDRIGELIEQLDVRQAQVMLEVLLVSLSDGQSLDLGVELQQLIDDAGTLVGLASLFGISDIRPIAGDPGQAPLGSGSGGTVVVLDPGDFSAVVRAVENISEGRSLSIPKLLVNNNESGTINSTVEEPFISTNASETVATTSFGGSSAAGTQISVTPQIAEGDHIILQYSVSLSAFVGESADPALPPPRQQNTISSRATIPDGYTIAVGGIEVSSEAEAEARVPLLGEIPGIGELFKTRSKSRSRSRFFAFIRANVMRHTSFEDLKHTSTSMRTAAGLAEDGPELSPRIIR